MMRRLPCLFLMLLQLGSVASMRVSQVPFKYNIWARDWRNKTKLVPCRTSPDFFSKIFGIRPGGDPSISYDTWMGLKSSPLFTNLTLEAVGDKYGDLQFVVSGTETPSRTFSPEVALSSSRFGEPQISGGLQLTDNHFRGRGETLQVGLTLPEDSLIMTARPDIRITWSDNRIGKSSRVSVGYQQIKDDSTFKEFVAQRGTPDKLLSKQEFNEKKSQFSTLSRKGFATLARAWSFNKGKVSANMEPYVAEDRLMPRDSPNAFFASIMSGVKSTFEWRHPSGVGSVQVEHDGGATSSPRGRALYHVVEVTGKVTSPAVSSLYYLAQPLKRLFTGRRKPPVNEFSEFDQSEASTVSDGSNNESFEGEGRFVGSTQHKIKFARGRGCNDLHHFSDLTRSRIVRRPALEFDTALPPEPEPEPEPVPVPQMTVQPKRTWWGGYTKETTQTIDTTLPSSSSSATATTTTSPPAPSVSPSPTPFLQNLASYYLAYKTDLGYEKPSWWGTPGMFVDIAHSHHPLPPSATHGSDIYAISAGAGVSLRFKGVRLELAWPVFLKQYGQQTSVLKSSNSKSWLDTIRPTVYLGFDFDN